MPIKIFSFTQHGFLILRLPSCDYYTTLEHIAANISLADLISIIIRKYEIELQLKIKMFLDTIPLNNLSSHFKNNQDCHAQICQLLQKDHTCNTQRRERLLAKLKQLPQFINKFNALRKDEIHHVLQSLQLLSFEPAQVIINAGQKDNQVFYILNGSLKVIIVKDNKLQPVRQLLESSDPTEPESNLYLEEGSFFGQISSLFSIARTATVVGATKGHLLVIPGSEVHKLYRSEEFSTTMQIRIQTIRSLFPEEVGFNLVPLAYYLKQKNYKQGETIYKQYSESDGLYFVKQGIVRLLSRFIVRGQPREDPIYLRQLRQGDAFGEEALFRLQVSAAFTSQQEQSFRFCTAVSATPAVLYFISFQKLSNYQKQTSRNNHLKQVIKSFICRRKSMVTLINRRLGDTAEQCKMKLNKVSGKRISKKDKCFYAKVQQPTLLTVDQRQIDKVKSCLLPSIKQAAFIFQPCFRRVVEIGKAQTPYKSNTTREERVARGLIKRENIFNQRVVIKRARRYSLLQPLR